MSKRSFRETPAPRADRPRYPTLDDFDQGRRSALRRLGAIGAALLGAGSLLACGDRSVTNEPDLGVGPQGAAPMPDGRIDDQQKIKPKPDAGPVDPDFTVEGGVARVPDARIERPDEGQMAGGAPMPPAELDAR